MKKKTISAKQKISKITESFAGDGRGPELFANWRSKSFVVALRSKCYNKDWEQTARPKGTRPNKNYNYKLKFCKKDDC